MKRIFSVLAVVAVMAALVAASAMPAFAEASDDAGCKGQLSEFATQAPGYLGQMQSFYAKKLGGLGEEFGDARSCNPNASEQGGGS